MNDVEKVFANSALHDYKMEKMEIDYPKGTVVLQLLNLKNIIKKITISRFIDIEFTNKEKWGKGTYVVSSDAFYIDNILNIKKFSKNVCKEFVDKIVIYNDKKFDFYLKGYDTSFNFNEESNISYLPH